MGAFRMLSTGGDFSPQPPNPNPRNFKTELLGSYDRSCAVEVTYPDCTNFEGRKALVFAIPWVALQSRISETGELDPHFMESNDLVARFRPGPWGQIEAKRLARRLSS